MHMQAWRDWRPTLALLPQQYRKPLYQLAVPSVGVHKIQLSALPLYVRKFLRDQLEPTYPGSAFVRLSSPLHRQTLKVG